MPNDTTDQGAADSSRARINKPYSRRSHKFEAEGGYRILSNAKVGLGYEYETVERDFTEVEDTDEHTGRINLRATPTPTVTTWLEYEFATRDGSEYVSNRPFLVSHTDAFIAGESPDDLFENNPFLRKFYIADRRRHLVKGAITAMPTDNLVLGLSGSYNKSDYHNTEIGLTDMNLGNITGDVAFMPTDNLTLTGFVTYESGSYDMTGFERVGFGPFSSITPDDDLDFVQTFFNHDGFWTADMRTHGFTLGAGIEWEAIPDRLNFTVDYAYSDMTTEFDLDAERFATPSLPDLESKLHSVGVTGEYKFDESISGRLGFRFEHYDQEDFALDGSGLSTSSFLGFGNDSPSYNAHVVWG
ncbi:MAG: MtrB/PioB family outer membrane beta-barrel protein, partial [Halobacteriales archaeon]|nr:MtrB/PioB family outer membrane beta-barrel protein [Halobacteriales archaeon]